MKYNVILGVDVSKEWLDLCLLVNGQILWQDQIVNTKTHIKRALVELRRTYKLSYANMLIVLEHTGIYGAHLLQVAWSKNIAIWMEHALHIKSSNRMTRNKSDKVDAQRIAMYALRFQDKLKLWTPPRRVVQELKTLSRTRHRMVKIRTMLVVPLNEMDPFAKECDKSLVKDCTMPILEQLNEQISTIERKITELIQGDENLSKQVKQITSIKGVGIVTAVNMVIETEEFTKYADAKKLACACGVAPHEQSSGKHTSRRRVSHKANKRLKTLLTQCARSALKGTGEIRDYYDRKVREGKQEFSIINAIRNKLVHRIFAVIRDDVMYNPKYQYMLA